MSNFHSPVISNIKYNIAWHTKQKVPLLSGEIKPRLQVILRQVCAERGVQILGGNIGTNHVYMKLDCPAHQPPADIVKRLKGRASKILRDEFPVLRDLKLEGSLWEDGYFCHSFGNDDEELVRKYIKE